MTHRRLARAVGPLLLHHAFDLDPRGACLLTYLLTYLVGHILLHHARDLDLRSDDRRHHAHVPDAVVWGPQRRVRVDPSTLEPSTREPSTLEPSTREPSTLEPSTLEPSTREPSTRKVRVDR